MKDQLENLYMCLCDHINGVVCIIICVNHMCVNPTDLIKQMTLFLNKSNTRNLVKNYCY